MEYLEIVAAKPFTMPFLTLNFTVQWARSGSTNQQINLPGQEACGDKIKLVIPNVDEQR